MASKSGNQDIARRYATAFFELAKESAQIDQISADIVVVGALLVSGGDFTRFIRNVTIRRDVQAKALVEIAKHLKLSSLTEKFLGVLAQKRRLTALPEIVIAVQSLIDAHKGEVTEHVTAAKELDPSQKADIALNLKKVLGLNVKVNLDIDPAIMGGLVIRVGSKLMDSSIRTKLDRLHRTLKQTNELSDKAKMREVA